MASFVECCICFEEIGTMNNCTTPCGHKFCFTCMSKCLVQNNTCPCCRSVLMEEKDDEDDSDYEDDSDTESNYSFDEEENLDKITERFLALGYTTNDLVSMLIGRVKEKRNYTRDCVEKMFSEFNAILEENDDEKTERELFAAEDLRTN